MHVNIYRENIFPVLNELATRQFSLYRRQLLSQVPQQAEVLEIGFGTGTSIAEYQPKIKMLTALEPNSGMLARAKKNPTLQAKFRINLIEGACEALPFDAASFDCVVSILTLCSVDDVQTSLREILRVLKPGGKLLFLEHSLQPAAGLTRSIQQALTPVWRVVACGCNLNRSPIEEIKRSGLVIRKIDTLGHDGFPNLVSPIYCGVAER